MSRALLKSHGARNAIRLPNPTDSSSTTTVNSGTNQVKVKLASTPGDSLTISAYGTKIPPTPTVLTLNPLGLTVTDAKNQTTTYTYDNMDRLAPRKDALNRTESYQYDLAGNLTQFTDRKNQVTTFQYDALNRRTQATYGTVPLLQALWSLPPSRDNSRLWE
ncbi:MAG: hypothetical protein OEW13_12830 [Nitrospira sp.]|nr:hypothetical protein [Nitrospira sp.]